MLDGESWRIVELQMNTGTSHLATHTYSQDHSDKDVSDIKA